MTRANYIDRILQPVAHALTPELAQALVDLRADPETLAEVESLREKSSHGTLTVEEEQAYKAFVDAVDVISVLQSKARRFLKNQGN